MFENIKMVQLPHCHSVKAENSEGKELVKIAI